MEHYKTNLMETAATKVIRVIIKLLTAVNMSSIVHQTNAAKEWRGDPLGGVILVRGTFISAELSLYRCNKELRRKCTKRESKWTEWSRGGEALRSREGYSELTEDWRKLFGGYLDPSSPVELLSGQSERLFQGVLNGMLELSSFRPFLQALSSCGDGGVLKQVKLTGRQQRSLQPAGAWGKHESPRVDAIVLVLRTKHPIQPDVLYVPTQNWTVTVTGHRIRKWMEGR